MDNNLAWLTQKTEDSKCNKPNFTFSPHTQLLQLNCKIIKNVVTPTISTATPPPLSGLSPLSSKFLVSPPQVTQFLEGPTPPPPFIKGRVLIIQRVIKQSMKSQRQEPVFSI